MMFTPCKVGDFWITLQKKISFRFPLTKYGFLDSSLKINTWQLTEPESPRGRRNLHVSAATARDSNIANDPASDPSLLQSVKKLHELCKVENNEDLVARVYPQINKIFQRVVASLSQSQTSNGLLLIAILQFYLDFGEVVLHDADPSLMTFLGRVRGIFLGFSTADLGPEGLKEDEGGEGLKEVNKSVENRS
ncbi:AP-5 complex subunit zeta-1 [Trifolium repens]|nr:AP-5 complex subunit zeta-1 [Trifolium repens]